MSARQDLEAPNLFMRAVLASLDVVPQAFFSEDDCATLLSKIAQKVEVSNWTHFEVHDTVKNTLDELVSDIEARGSHKATLQAIAMHSGRAAQ